MQDFVSASIVIFFLIAIVWHIEKVFKSAFHQHMIWEQERFTLKFLTDLSTSDAGKLVLQQLDPVISKYSNGLHYHRVHLIEVVRRLGALWRFYDPKVTGISFAETERQLPSVLFQWLLRFIPSRFDTKERRENLMTAWQIIDKMSPAEASGLEYFVKFVGERRLTVFKAMRNGETNLDKYYNSSQLP
jgi:hypothetical protein